MPDPTIIVLAITVLIAFFFFSIPSIIIFWVLTRRVGKPGWSQLIPFYSMFVQGEVADQPGLARITIGLTGISYILSLTKLDTIYYVALGASSVFSILLLFAFVRSFRGHGFIKFLYVFVPLVGLFFLSRAKYRYPEWVLGYDKPVDHETLMTLARHTRSDFEEPREMNFCLAEISSKTKAAEISKKLKEEGWIPTLSDKDEYDGYTITATKEGYSLNEYSYPKDVQYFKALATTHDVMYDGWFAST